MVEYFIENSKHKRYLKYLGRLLHRTTEGEWFLINGETLIGREKELEKEYQLLIRKNKLKRILYATKTK